MIRLGVNIDHVATVRQARQTVEPDPVQAAVLAELGGADGITVHLRGDRRHIQYRDVVLLSQTVAGTLNLEMALHEDDEVLETALDLRPQQVCLVPENREELTTEGGLNLDRNVDELRSAITQLQDNGTQVSLFIEPDTDTIRKAHDLGAQAVELHTGTWANAWLAAKQTGMQESINERDQQLERLRIASEVVNECGMLCHAGHGITYHNVSDLIGLIQACEYNIGHTIVARALLVGMQQAVHEMKTLLNQ